MNCEYVRIGKKTAEVNFSVLPKRSHGDAEEILHAGS
jgi:hypothetical protein